MEYKEIVSVTGFPGLFQLVTTKGNGIIIRTLNGDNTRFVSARSHNFTPLESIEVFTTYENVPLSEVFIAMQKNESETPLADPKSKEEVKTYFEKVFPDLDEDRVYMSDLKKMLKWYPVLKEYDLLPEEEVEEEEK
ncbi:MAG TPA: DUF5606 domain-containing protein [Chitinophagaceae bacterium]|nr:DUF5606 domain-containing protein [Chitinophagaceae bacterium]